MSTQGFSVGDALSNGWNKMTDHLGFLVGFILITTLTPFIPNFAAQYFAMEHPYVASTFFVLMTIVGVLMTMALYRLSIALANDESPKWKYLISTFNLFFNFAIANILYTLIIVGGLLLLIVPGVVWGLRYSYWGFNVIDKKMGPFEALKHSGQQTYGIKWDLFALALLTIFINILGALCFLVGLFVTIPVTWIAWAWVYRRTTSPQTEESSEVQV